MLKLFIKNNVVTSGTVPISWCIDEETINNFVKKGVADPVIVISVFPEHNKSKDHRIIAPLRDLMAYVEFFCKGKNRIFAFVCSSMEEAKMYLEPSSYNKYFHSVGNYNGDDYATDFNMELRAEPLEIEVPAECFAPEPPEWEKCWVNWLFRQPPIDQCDYRRRRMFAYSIQHIIMAFNLIWRILITLLALSIGSKEFSFRPLLHPIDVPIEYVTDICEGGSIFIGKGESRFLNYARMIFMPIIFIPLVIFFIVGAKGAFSLLLVLKIFALIIGAIVVTVATCVGICHIIEVYEEKQKFWYLNKEQMKAVLCDGSAKTTELSKLPRKNRSIKLRFYDLKSKVCRPFSS